MTAMVSMINPITAVMEGEWVMSFPSSYQVRSVNKAMAGYMLRAHFGQARSKPSFLTRVRRDMEVTQEETASQGHIAQNRVPPPATRKINKAHHQVQVRTVAMFRLGLPNKPVVIPARMSVPMEHWIC